MKTTGAKSDRKRVVPAQECVHSSCFSELILPAKDWVCI